MLTKIQCFHFKNKVILNHNKSNELGQYQTGSVSCMTAAVFLILVRSLIFKKINIMSA